LQLLKLDSHDTVFSSNADHGKFVLNELKRSLCFEIFESQSGSTVFDAAFVAEATTKKPEGNLVAFLTPKLDEIVKSVDSSLVLVNSEVFRWLKGSSLDPKVDSKPDFFTSHQAFATFKSRTVAPYPTLAEQRFGAFNAWNCRDSINAVWEAKLKIDEEAYGEIFTYLKRIGEDKNTIFKEKLKSRGILFDSRKFSLVTAIGTTIHRVIECEWNMTGSLELLRSFLAIRDPWHVALQKSPCSLDIRFDDSACCLLGRGACGRVFRIVGGKAVKVVLGEKGVGINVHREYGYMKNAHQLCEDCVASVGNDSFFCGNFELEIGNSASISYEYAGYILDSIGSPVDLKGKPIFDTILPIALTIFALHAKGIIHGDPRLPNILSFGTNLRWIDFRETVFLTFAHIQTSFESDIEIFLKSLCKTNEKYWDKEIDQVIAQYALTINGDQAGAKKLLEVIIVKVISSHTTDIQNAWS